jgi:hypothetical protein
LTFAATNENGTARKWEVSDSGQKTKIHISTEEFSAHPKKNPKNFPTKNVPTKNPPAENSPGTVVFYIK